MDQATIYILVVFGISLVLTMLALIDIILKDFGSPRTKLMWHFVAIIPLFGWLIYLIFGFKKGKRRNNFA